MVAVVRSVLVGSPVADVEKVALDPAVALPILGGFGKSAFVARYPGGTEEWDVYLNVGTILVGGRVLVEPPSEHALTWRSTRGAQQRARIEVAPAEKGAQVTMWMTVEFVGGLSGWLTGQLARGILARNMEAWLQQLRHQIEYGP